MSREIKPLDPKTAAPQRRRRATSTTVATPISRERAPMTLPPPVPPRMGGLRRADRPAGPCRSSGSRFFPENGETAMAPAHDVEDGGTRFATETAPKTLPPPAAPSTGLVDGAAGAGRTISRDGGGGRHGNGQNVIVVVGVRRRSSTRDLPRSVPDPGTSHVRRTYVGSTRK